MNLDLKIMKMLKKLLNGYLIDKMLVNISAKQARNEAGFLMLDMARVT